jgi:hypothetical protein
MEIPYCLEKTDSNEWRRHSLEHPFMLIFFGWRTSSQIMRAPVKVARSDDWIVPG